MIAAIFLAYLYVFAFGQSIRPAVSLASDDAFYYFQIARNIVRGEGCTFDGIAPTNGFHPLWMVCVLFVYKVAGTDIETPVRMIFVLNGLLCILTLLLIHRIIHKYVAPGLGLIAVSACLLPNVFTGMTNGLETGLLLLMVAALLWLCYSRTIHLPLTGAKSSFAMGVVLGLIALCRLDSVFLLAAAACLTGLAPFVTRLTVQACILALVCLFGGFALVTGPYLAWNILYFGHAMPISGAAKSSFPSLRDPLTLSGDMILGAVLLAALVALALFIAAHSYLRTRSMRPIFRSPLTLLVLSCVLHYVHAFLFLSWGVYWWHFVIYGLSIAVALPLAVDQVTSGRPRQRRVLSTALIASMIVGSIALKGRELRIKGAQHVGWLEAADWARIHTPPDAIIALRDAGLFGYFSDRRVINLDAKANCYEYLQHLKQDDVEGYLRNVGTTFIANVNAEYHSGKSMIALPRVNQPMAIIVVDQAAEVFRSEPIPSHSARVGEAPKSYFTIWRYPGDQTVDSK